MYDKERKHWITTHYRNGKVFVYDSYFSGSLSPSMQEMIVRLYRPAVQDNSLVVMVMLIVKQRGSTDCGLFTISTAFQAASRLCCNLKQEDLRQHVLINLDSGLLTPFPTTKSRKNKLKHVVIKLYCLCSLPAEFDATMVQCDKCGS